MARRTSLAALATDTVDDVPGRSDPLLMTLSLDKLHCTRFNPRRNFGTDEELKEFGQKLDQEQLQPAVVVSRSAYLKLWPDEANNVGEASYVIANGERRYRASALAGRKLEVILREDVAKSRATFLDAVQSENNDRKDLDEIERAIAIDTMVAELGGANEVAAYYDKSKGWVSQQRKLLKLTPEMQEKVSAGEIPVRVARDIAGLPADEQEPAWQRELEQRAEAKAQPKAPRTAKTEIRTEPDTGQRFTAVNQTAGANASGPAPDDAETETTDAAAAGDPGRFTAVNSEAASKPASTVEKATLDTGEEPGGPSDEPGTQDAAGDGVPGQREEQSDDASRPAPVWDEPGAISGMIRMRMKDPHFFTMLGYLLKQGAERDEQELRKVLSGYIAST